MLLDRGVGKALESRPQGDPTCPSSRRSVLGVHWKDWCWSWNSNTLATWCEELTHLKRPWCWDRLRAGGEGDDRGWDGWMASLTRWTWVWVDSGSWWWTGRPGVLWVTAGLDTTEWLNWTEYNFEWCSVAYNSSSALGQICQLWLPVHILYIVYIKLCILVHILHWNVLFCICFI